MEPDGTTRWTTVLELGPGREVVGGSEHALVEALSRGADMRIYTEFVHNEHIDVQSSCDERILEVAEFGVTYVVGGTWAAGVMSLRQPIELPEGFGPRPSMSFFLYSQDGSQAIARPHLDGRPPAGAPGPSPALPPPNMPKYHCGESWDGETNAPSSNFAYDFDAYRFCVSDTWREAFAHDDAGEPISGSLDDLVAAFKAGAEVKVGVGGVCADLDGADAPPPGHELLVQAGPGYYYSRRRLFMAGTHPVVRVGPAIPMRYRTGNWDFGWLLVRTDGHVAYRRCDPYTLQFEDRILPCPVRWFVR